MYSPKVLEHLENPRNVGEMAGATACGEATNPVCGDLLRLYLRVDVGKIIEASFKVQGCPPSIAAGSALTEMITNLALEEARALRPQDVTRALEYLPRNKEHCSVLAIDALRAALDDTLSASLDDALSASLDDALSASLDDALSASLDDQI